MKAKHKSLPLRFNMNPTIRKLQPYPFEKLARLLLDTAPPSSIEKIMLSIGEPQHPSPELALHALSDNLADYSKYSATKGIPELREAISQWCISRYHLNTDLFDASNNVLPVSGTREALFSFTQAAIDRASKPTTLLPNPCYQIYEGASILAGAEPYYLPCLEENNYIPRMDDVPEQIKNRCQLIFICTPGNPTGSVMQLEHYKTLFSYADQYNWIIASDECYSELYFDESNPPMGLLDACVKLGRTDFKRCIVFNSLSKRSSLAGMRSGFVAGDANILKQYLQYRTYHGCTIPLPVQLASIAAWSDEQHVISNRAIYRKKYQILTGRLQEKWPLTIPDGSFYLWAKTPIDDIDFAKQLFAETHIVVLPGQFLSRHTHSIDPGKNRVRMALVASIDHINQAADRIDTSSLF